MRSHLAIRLLAFGSVLAAPVPKNGKKSETERIVGTWTTWVREDEKGWIVSEHQRPAK